VTVYNVAPTVVAGADQTVLENDMVSFNGTATDPGVEDVLTYSWNFGDGTTASGDLNPTHTYGDDGVYTVTLTVSDGDGGVTSDSLMVTVDNVDPTVTPMSFSQPNGQFILPQVHELTFRASSADPGSDDATFVWDFGDGTVITHVFYNNGASADPYPSPGVKPMSASDSVRHTYAAPGDYTVIATVTDDDGGLVGTQLYPVHVADPAEALDVTDHYVQALPSTAFKPTAALRKIALGNMFAALDAKLALKEYKGMIMMLNADLRSKADGTLGGVMRDDWIIAPTVQAQFCQSVDGVSAYLKYLLTH